MLTQLARSSYRHRRLVVLAWLAVLVAAVVVGPALAGRWASGDDAPKGMLQQEFPARSGADGTIVFGDVVAGRSAIEHYLAQVRAEPGVTAVEPLQLSPGGRVAIAAITLADGDRDDPDHVAQRIEAMAEPLRHDGVPVAFGGDSFTEGSMPATELIGILAAVVVLLLAFGSVVAMGLPILTALVGVGIGVAGVGVIAHLFSTPEFTPEVASMIGIGVGIDYALFIVTRYRDALGRLRSPEAAVVEAMSTAGRAVTFAGCTVMVSILGMFLMGLDFLHGLAVGSSFAVAIAVLAAITLLPAMLGFVGCNIDRLRVHRRAPSSRVGLWTRWSVFVQRRPAPIAIAGLGVLVLAAFPVLGMRLGFADEGNDPRGTTTRTAYDLVADGFGPGANGPVVVVADTSSPARAATLPRLAGALRSSPGVASVGDPVRSASGNAALMVVTPTTGPQDPATARLVHHLRDDVIPAATLLPDGKTHVPVEVAGETALNIDFSDQIAARLPLFIGAVLAASFLLLLLVFRSVLVPLKAVLMNLLSIGAAYGVMVAVFQWGWLSGPLGIAGAPIAPWAPMMLFAIVFGLSMDYEVFLLSSIRERYDATGDNSAAVSSGLAATARVITAAATIMVCVFGSFVLSDVRDLKLIGLGLAVAVALDATIVRIVLVPATMELLGRANWWLPRWLARLLPTVHVEGRPASVDPQPADVDARPAPLDRPDAQPRPSPVGSPAHVAGMPSAASRSAT